MDSDLFVKREEKKGEKARVENFTTKTDSLSDPKRTLYTALRKVSDGGSLCLGLFGYWPPFCVHRNAAFSSGNGQNSMKTITHFHFHFQTFFYIHNEHGVDYLCVFPILISKVLEGFLILCVDILPLEAMSSLYFTLCYHYTY
jgi:hypothetical protein